MKNVNKKTIIKFENIQNGIFEQFKNLKKLPQKQPKPKLKKSYKEASNKKKSENKLVLELKNINNDIFKNFKNDTKKPNFLTNLKSHLRQHLMKKFRKHTIVRIGKH